MSYCWYFGCKVTYLRSTLRITLIFNGFPTNKIDTVDLWTDVLYSRGTFKEKKRKEKQPRKDKLTRVASQREFLVKNGIVRKYRSSRQYDSSLRVSVEGKNDIYVKAITTTEKFRKDTHIKAYNLATGK